MSMSVYSAYSIFLKKQGPKSFVPPLGAQEARKQYFASEKTNSTKEMHDCLRIVAQETLGASTAQKGSVDNEANLRFLHAEMPSFIFALLRRNSKGSLAKACVMADYFRVLFGTQREDARWLIAIHKECAQKAAKLEVYSATFIHANLSCADVSKILEEGRGDTFVHAEKTRKEMIALLRKVAENTKGRIHETAIEKAEEYAQRRFPARTVNTGQTQGVRHTKNPRL